MLINITENLDIISYGESHDQKLESNKKAAVEQL